MKRTVILIITILSIHLSFSQSINQQVLDKRGNDMLIGIINKKGLSKAPFKKWFKKNYKDYDVNDRIIKKLSDSLNDYTIKVFLGTWCGDSRREIPRFYNIIEVANFPENQLEVIALNSSGENYKQGPNREEKGMNIHRVPTFIFYKDGKEVNRIVEEPVETFERDILRIMSGKKYRPKYNAANRLGHLLNEKPIDSLNKKVFELRDALSESVKHSGELNTLGYVLLSANEIDKALLTFKINNEIFPYKVNTIDSYAEALYEKKDYIKALKNYYKVLSIKPEDKNATEMIKKINLEMN